MVLGRRKITAVYVEGTPTGTHVVTLVEGVVSAGMKLLVSIQKIVFKNKHLLSPGVRPLPCGYQTLSEGDHVTV